MQKKLSIMLPVYNMEIYINECFQSLVRQNWASDVEIIIIDDGSTDASYDICKKYVSKYDYMKLYHKENGGVASARNMALKYATGEYFYWVDPDDYIADDFWEKVKPILSHGYDFIFFDLVYFSDKDFKKSFFGGKSKNIEKSLLIRLLCDGVKMASHLHTKILKKSLWEGIDFPENISLCEDYAVLTYIAIKAEKIFYLHENLYNYRQRTDSICHSISVADLTLAYQLVNHRYEYFRQEGFDVDIAGILCVEYGHLKTILMRENISENATRYQGIYIKMLKHLKKNKSILLRSDLINDKDRILIHLLVHDMKKLINILLNVWNLLKKIRI